MSINFRLGSAVIRMDNEIKEKMFNLCANTASACSVLKNVRIWDLGICWYLF